MAAVAPDNAESSRAFVVDLVNRYKESLEPDADATGDNTIYSSPPPVLEQSWDSVVLYSIVLGYLDVAEVVKFRRINTSYYKQLTLYVERLVVNYFRPTTDMQQVANVAMDGGGWSRAVLLLAQLYRMMDRQSRRVLMARPPLLHRILTARFWMRKVSGTVEPLVVHCGLVQVPVYESWNAETLQSRMDCPFEPAPLEAAFDINSLTQLPNMYFGDNNAFYSDSDIDIRNNNSDQHEAPYWPLQRYCFPLAAALDSHLLALTTQPNDALPLVDTEEWRKQEYGPPRFASYDLDSDEIMRCCGIHRNLNAIQLYTQLTVTDFDNDDAHAQEFELQSFVSTYALVCWYAFLKSMRIEPFASSAHKPQDLWNVLEETDEKEQLEPWFRYYSSLHLVVE